jgi:hypothetical protein
MASTFCSILTAYLLGEFIFRSKWIHVRKRRARAAALRGAVVTLMSYLLLGNPHWQILLGILATNTAMAAVEMRTSDSVVPFALEQCAYLLVLVGLAWRFPGAATEGWWFKTDLSKWYFAVLSCISGLVACVPAGGILVGKFMLPFTDEVRNDDIAGLARGGRYIGWLERLLVLLLLMMDQPNGIGFLIAAKSILRFGEIRETGQRKVAEYIIIGTFASFGWVLFISVLTQKAIKHWAP